MKKATITYTAPKGESKTLDIAGVTLLTGKPDTVICDQALMDRLSKAGGMLKVEGVADYTPPPPKPEEPAKEEHHGKAQHGR